MTRLAAVLLVTACAAPPRRDAAEVEAAFEAVHARVYDLYALGPDRDALHDHLAGSFAGEALTAAYVEHWRTLHRMDEEQTGILVTGVEYEDLWLLDEDPVRVEAAWLVRGVVRHQRHRHPRINRYRAIYTLAETAGGWRIVDTHMTDLSRVATEVAGDLVFDPAEGSGAAEGFMDPLELLEAGLFDTDEGTRP